jgi:hypothetical protein
VRAGRVLVHRLARARRLYRVPAAATCGTVYAAQAGQLLLAARSAGRVAAAVNLWAASAVGAR